MHLGGLLAAAAARNPQRKALGFESTGERLEWTHGRLSEASLAIACGDTLLAGVAGSTCVKVMPRSPRPGRTPLAV